MLSVTVTIADLFEFEGKLPPAERPDDAAIGGMVQRQFRFLPQPIKLFEKSIAANPELPNPHQGLALTYQRMGQLEAAEAALDVLFTKTKPQDMRSAPVFATGRALYAEVEKALAKKQHSPSRQWRICGATLSFCRGIPCA